MEEFKTKRVDARPLLWIHDEVVWRFPKALTKWCKGIVDYHMTKYKLSTEHGMVPLDVEGHLAPRWEK